ncbi:MAG: Ig-like domain-containing protein [Oscillospiraceae bacterium]|jgi:uncharacterized protein YjdB|nr:Ig-like domain-containing protein [Oscillospiraceae bacterium]
MQKTKRILAAIVAVIMIVSVFTVAASAAEATGIKVSQTALTLGVGQSAAVTATLTPTGSTTSKKTWKSSSTAIAAVDANGKITGKKAGSATITVTTAKNKAATVKVTVKAAPAKLALPASLTLAVGQTSTPKVTTAPSNAQTTRTWASSNTAIAAVDANGKITPKKAGTAYITVKSYNGKVSNKLKLTVKAKPAPTKIAVNKASVTIDQTLTLKPTLTFTPYYANTAVTYKSSNTKIATVAANGTIKGIAKGTATITIYSSTAKKNMATVKVTVKPAPTGVKVTSAATLTLGAGQTSVIANTVSPSDARNTRSYISSNKDVATVDSAGKVTVKKYGVAVITVKTWNGKTAKVTVNGYNAPAGITYKLGTATSATLGVGQSVSPVTTLSGSNVLTKRTYTSNKSAVVTVDAAGKLKAVAAGSATITVNTWNGKSAAFKVTVVASPSVISGFKTVPPTLYAGQTGKIATPYEHTFLRTEYQMVPNGSWGTSKGLFGYYWDKRDVYRDNDWNAGIYGAKWETDKSAVATVSGGTVTAIKEGTAKITLTYWNGIKGSVNVTVKPAPTSIALSAKTLSLAVRGTNASVKLGYTYAPPGAEGYPVKSWESSNKAVATVDANGTVTAVKGGTATITVTSDNGKKDTCVVTVEDYIDVYNKATKKFTEAKAGYTEQTSLNITNVKFSDTITTIMNLIGAMSGDGGIVSEMEKSLITSEVSDPAVVPKGSESISLLQSRLTSAHIKPGGAIKASDPNGTRYTLKVVDEVDPTGANCTLAAFTNNYFGQAEMRILFGYDEMTDEAMKSFVDTILNGLTINTKDVAIVSVLDANGNFKSVEQSIGLHCDLKLSKDLIKQAAHEALGDNLAVNTALLFVGNTVDILTVDIQMRSTFTDFIY